MQFSPVPLTPSLLALSALFNPSSSGAFSVCFFPEDDVTLLHENKDLGLKGQEITSFALLAPIYFMYPTREVFP